MTSFGLRRYRRRTATASGWSGQTATAYFTACSWTAAAARRPGAEALAERLARQPLDQRVFDLVVCTHIDADHIGGLLALVDDPPQGFATADVWFNGRDHLDILGPVQGDHLSDGLRNSSSPWNRRFDGHAVVIPGRGGLTVVELPACGSRCCPRRAPSSPRSPPNGRGSSAR